MKTQAVIDRLEGEKAVLLLGVEEREAVWPRAFLPQEAQEGDVLQLEINCDPEATAAARAEADALLHEILGRNK